MPNLFLRHIPARKYSHINVALVIILNYVNNRNFSLHIARSYPDEQSQ
jgi:hypothetical protein